MDMERKGNMDRLTEKLEGHESYYYPHCFESGCSETSGLCICEDCSFPNKVCQKLGEYEDLEEQGKLLKLPCAVGDTVWDIDFGRPRNYEVTGFSFGSLNDDDWEEKVLEQVIVYYTNSSGSITGTFAVSEIGKTVFLTKEAAEAALKEMSKE